MCYNITMNLYFEPKLKKLANSLALPLYAVGGYVRNYLIDGSISTDVDLCAPILACEVEEQLLKFGFTILCSYKRTGTLVFSGDNGRYEFTSFRKETYAEGGGHSPVSTEFTTDISLDAIRRDFKCNAIYYDIKNDKIVDVLGGVKDIENKVLDTVTDANEVFSHDGLRLMRLCRLSAELSFTPTAEVLDGAKQYAKNILDISAERIMTELKLILLSDSKYPFSKQSAHYDGLKMLSDIGVLDYILPELTKGRGMVQRADFHNYDVLEHSLRSVLYAPKEIRLASLLHDIGKPYCMQEYSKYHAHDVEGEKIVRAVLKRLKADNKTIEEVAFLTRYHMLDIKSEMREAKLKRFIVKNEKYLDKLLMLKQADFSACKDCLGVAPTVVRWKKLYEDMRSKGVPFSLKQVNIEPLKIKALGANEKDIGKILDELWDYLILYPDRNDEQYLTERVKDIICGYKK